MQLRISANFAFEFDQPTDALLQFEAAAIPEQTIHSARTQLSETEYMARVPAQDSIGERIWLRADGRCEVAYEAVAEPHRLRSGIASLAQLAAHRLPGETIEYLLDSRYCPASRFQPFVDAEFSGTSGGARIEAIRSWIAQTLAYAPGSSDAGTDAVATFIARRGICRDFAHLLVTFARASAIPARYVACFAPGVTPQDFHAVAEVFLPDPSQPDGGAWQLVDATGMADATDIVKIGVGRDAADVSFLTSFGPNRFLSSEIAVEQV
ncbi:transglutaminase family protein [Erythrobacter sp. JK5]|nr:transglutaminase family protein [Erythrobacter sp. JK5]QUL39426.1 transglutaminase family protein [Erythrobacter sp. JK5]